MRLVYLGTPAMAVPPLRSLVAAGHDVALVVSRADTRRGRGGATSPSPVKAAALELGLPVTSEVDDVLDTGAELGVVVAFGRIIRPHVLAALPMVNLHFSLLPRWRGAAPVERAILAGDDRTGVCVMDVDETLDTGAVHARAEIPLDDRITADDVRAELVRLGSELLVDTLAVGLGRPVPQDPEGITYAEKLGSEDLHLDWVRPAGELHRMVRVGGAWTTFRDKRLKVVDAGPVPDGVVPPAAGPGEVLVARGAAPVVVAADGSGLALRTVQPEGRAVMDATAWANGHRPEPGERLGQ
ncbi:MAG: methionyl-tRNA formyltransferase [Microthrixaceae bacterium]